MSDQYTSSALKLLSHLDRLDRLRRARPDTVVDVAARMREMW